MKLLTRWAVSAVSVLLVSAAGAQAPAPADTGRTFYHLVSDFDGPYGGPPPAPPPYGAPSYVPAEPYGAESYGYEPALLPPREVYAVLRENGFLPFGLPRRQGYVYEISAIDPDGEDGRLVIDGRTGRIIRFMPAFWGGRTDNSGLRTPYGAQAAVPMPTVVRGVPRPPAPIPHMASRAPKPAATVPAKSAERVPQSSAEKSAPPQPQTAAVTPPPASAIGATVGETKPPESQIKPTEPMPPVQGLE
ncbi:hypothetical protein [Bradyrhizobium sp. ARR65]|uniref:hypothetical protein n=1 Tax=Bradyrhizobium sp. ARR65 TaxID=1040989 RepID=UPI0004647B28|nr:hypothetical protein [Bradyrhizobium sp. ARR65]